MCGIEAMFQPDKSGKTELKEGYESYTFQEQHLTGRLETSAQPGGWFEVGSEDVQ